MKHKIKSFAILWPFWFFTLAVFSPASAAAPRDTYAPSEVSRVWNEGDIHSDGEKDLELILAKCAEYCERLSQSALFFVCQENIQEEIYQYQMRRMVVDRNRKKAVSMSQLQPRPKRFTKNYTYDYQLIKKGNTITENRILLQENGKEKNEKNAGLKTQRFYAERSVFGPVGFLSREWQTKYNYKLKKEEAVEGKKVYVIEAKPKQEITGKPNYGKIWVDKEDFSIVRIEIEQESLAGYPELQKESEKRRVDPIITVTHDYNIMKNGLRFPSKITFKEEYDRGALGNLTKCRLFVTYDNYRFFTVEVEVKH